MSHLTYIKTLFQSLTYLKVALKKLNVNYKEKRNAILDRIYSHGLVVSQLEGNNVSFKWNGQEYELSVDLDFWNQQYPINNFISKVSQQYTGEVIISETQSTGFETVMWDKNTAGSSILVLERWNLST